MLKKYPCSQTYLWIYFIYYVYFLDIIVQLELKFLPLKEDWNTNLKKKKLKHPSI